MKYIRVQSLRKIILIVIAILLSSCIGRRHVEDLTAKKITIAYITPSESVSFWLWVLEGIQKQCDSNEWELIVFDSENDPDVQLRNAKTALSSNIDGLIISPVDSISCQSVLDLTSKAYIPTIICDIGTVAGEYLSYISTPNYKGAFQAGEFVTDYLSEHRISNGRAVEITIPLERLNGRRRSDGFRDAMSTVGIEMETSIQIHDFTEEELIFDTNLALSEEPMLIWVHFSEAAVQVARQIRNRDLNREIIVASFDASPEILQLLSSGEILVCAAQQPKKMGRESVNALALYYAGGTPKKKISIPTLLLSKNSVIEMLPIIEDNICGIDIE